MPNDFEILPEQIVINKYELQRAYYQTFPTDVNYELMNSFQAFCSSIDGRLATRYKSKTPPDDRPRFHPSMVYSNFTATFKDKYVELGQAKGILTDISRSRDDRGRLITTFCIDGKMYSVIGDEQQLALGEKTKRLGHMCYVSDLVLEFSTHYKNAMIRVNGQEGRLTSARRVGHIEDQLAELVINGSAGIYTVGSSVAILEG